MEEFSAQSNDKTSDSLRESLKSYDQNIRWKFGDSNCRLTLEPLGQFQSILYENSLDFSAKWQNFGQSQSVKCQGQEFESQNTFWLKLFKGHSVTSSYC